MDYQQKIIRELVNNIHNLYADDIAMNLKVITEDDYGKLLTDYLNEFIEIAENS